MIKLKGGIREAAKILQGLDPKQRKLVIEKMIQMNPELSAEIQQQMVVLEDLKYLTELMMRDLLKKVKVDDLAMALRGTSPDLIQKILSLVSSNNKKDMEFILKGPPKPVSEVQKAQEKVLAIVREMVEKGELVLSPDTETYV